MFLAAAGIADGGFSYYYMFLQSGVYNNSSNGSLWIHKERFLFGDKHFKLFIKGLLIFQQ